MVKIDFITGFLGSGKTTFLLQYARHLMNQGQKIGILEYDYGAINVDMVLLNELRGENCELEMLAAACDADCLKRRFKTKLISMAMSGYDRVIVEPSGVFDMDMFFDAIRDEPLENWYEIGSVIAIVNANLSEEMSEEEDFFLASQVSCAGKVVFSRSQLSSPQKMEATKAHILRAAEGIHCKKLAERLDELVVEKDWSCFTEADFDRLKNVGFYVGDYVKRIAGADLSISSAYYLNLPDSVEQMKGKIEALFASDEYGEIIRVKGFVTGEPFGYRINASQYEMKVDEDRSGQAAMIVIGKNLKQEKLDTLMQ